MADQLIKSLDKGLRILEILGNNDSPVTASELSKILLMNRSSTLRLLNTLKNRGFVSKPPNSKAFVLGPAVRSLANKNPWFQSLIQLSRKYLIQLADLTGEAAHIAILEGQRTLIVDNEMSPQAIGVTVRKGESGLIYCTAVGKALILDYTKGELKKLLGSYTLEALTPKTITNLDHLFNQLKYYRRQGFVVDDEEYKPGVRCIGVPVRDVSGQIVAAVGISAPLIRLPSRQYREVGEKVSYVARWISSELGGQVHFAKKNPFRIEKIES
jgi:DNA-binding IclR family transcriptional regulator